MARKDERTEQTEQTEEATAQATTVPAQALPLRYVGDGEYIMGVPARNLTAAEAAQFAVQIAAAAQATGRALYASSEA